MAKISTVSCYFAQTDIDNWKILSTQGAVLGWIHEVKEDEEYRLTWKVDKPVGTVLSTGRPVKHKGTRTYQVRGKTLSEVQESCLTTCRRWVRL